jgi:hypothetical protein
MAKMDHIGILRRAWNITWNYRALWVFGFLLALTTGGGSGGNGANATMRGPGDIFTWREPWPFSWQFSNALITLIISLVCVFLFLGIILTILRYVSETALIRMVDIQEASGEKLSWREGLRLGWSRQAFRIFLVDLVVGFSVLLAVLLLFAIAAAPLLLLLTENNPARIVGVTGAVGLGLFVILVLIVAAIILSLVNPMIYRSVVLEGAGVFDSIRTGVRMLRRRFTDILLIGLLLFGIGLLAALVMFPIVLVLLLLAAASGAIPGMAAYALVNQFANEGLAVFLGVLIGLPIFLLILLVPAAFLSGIVETFKSSTWTLLYRDINRKAALVFDAGSEQPAEPAEAA